MQQTLETGSSNVILQAEFKQTRTHWKWLFVCEAVADGGGPLVEMCVALLTQENADDYLTKFRAKGWVVSLYNITSAEEDPYSDLDSLLAEQ